MATKPHVPRKRETEFVEAPMPPARAWFASRPGEVSGDPRARTFGSVGPDTGYAGHLARGFRDRLVGGAIHRDDALAAGEALAARRAAACGRAPIAEDLEVAFLLLGVLEGAPGDWTGVGDNVVALVLGARRTPGLAAGLAAGVPEDWLVLKPADVRERLSREGPDSIWSGVEPAGH